MQRPFRIIATIVALVTGAAACSYQTTDDSLPSGPDLPPLRGEVLAVGDSILDGAYLFGDLTGALRGIGFDLDVVAETGRTVTWGIEQLEERPSVPEIAVVVLGTNPTPDLAAFEAEVRDLATELEERGALRILWVPPVGSSSQWDYTEKAAALRAVFAGDATVDVVDWDAEITGNDSWFGDDGLHLSDAGYRALARTITDEVELAAADLGG